jgi:hypothetical protein
MWPLNLLRSSKNRTERRAARRPHQEGHSRRARIVLGLETLEERCLLNGGDVTTTAGLVAAINEANSSSSPITIILAPGTTFDFTAANNSTGSVPGYNALPVITGNITIVGNGDTIERTGSSAFRFFTVQGQGASLTLQNLSLVGGLAEDTLIKGGPGEGGAIYGGPETVLNLGGVTVQSNEAVGGTGTYGLGAGNGGNGGNAAGGGIYVRDGSLTLTNDLIKANGAVGGDGGGCHALHFAGGNGGNALGGGVYVTGFSPSITLIGDTFAGNRVNGGNGGNANTGPYSGGGDGQGGTGGNAQGGGVYVTAGSPAHLTISGDDFSTNVAIGGNGGFGGNQTPDLYGPGLGGPGGNAQGGGLYALAASLTLNGVSVTNNAAVGGNGALGGLYFDSGDVHAEGGNGGSASGGGVYGTVAFSNISTLIDTVISQDTVTGGAAAVNNPSGGGMAISPLFYGYAMTLRASGIFSLPPCGGGRGWGVEVLWQQAFPPPTPTLPHKGGGSFVR